MICQSKSGIQSNGMGRLPIKNNTLPSRQSIVKQNYEKKTEIKNRYMENQIDNRFFFVARSAMNFFTSDSV